MILPQYELLLQVKPEHPRPWRIIETIQTVDGPAQHPIDQRFADVDSALGHMNLLESHARG